MHIRLDRDRPEPVVWEESLALEIAHELLQELSPVQCHGRVEANDAGFLVRAGLAYQQTLLCTRCLQPTTSRMRSELELRVVCHEDDEPGGLGEVELDSDEMSVLHIHGDMLDTEPLVVEQVMLELPMKPLCRADCLGLCPECGTDLNENGECCAGAPADPRWEGLETIRTRLAEAERAR